MRGEREVVIRKATNKDAQGIVNVLKSAKLPEETWTGNEKWVKRALQKSLSKENYTLLVAEYNHKIVGFVGYVVFPSFWECANHGMIIDFFVHEGFQGKGVGTGLIKTVVECADAEGFREMHVSTGLENTGARRLYGKYGFTQEHLLLERSREEE